MVTPEVWQTVALMAGGGTGAVLRYACGLALRREGGFAWGTFVVNVTGSGIMGAALALTASLPPDAFWRAPLVDGLLGGLTTFSTFAFETFTLGLQGAWKGALANVAAHGGLGLLAAMAGYALAGGC